MLKISRTGCVIRENPLKLRKRRRKASRIHPRPLSPRHRIGNQPDRQASNPFVLMHRRLIIDLAARHKLPTIYSVAIYVRDGGLISYGADRSDQYRGAARYVDRILKGEKPGELPVQLPLKY